MECNFDTSQEDRLKIAEELRENTIIPPTITEAMQNDLTSVDVEEISVPTQVGPSRVLKVSQHERQSSSPLFINFHGGGFVRGYHVRDTIFCAQLALATGALVLDVDYRLAPEHTFPTAITECYDVVAWAFKNAEMLGVDPSRICIGGHSAGGNIATVVSILAIEKNSFKLCGQVLDYPFLDAATPAEQKVEPNSLIPASRMQAFNVLYAGTPDNLSNPHVSPVFADAGLLSKLPRTLMLIAGLDPLRHEAHEYAGKLVKAGVDIDVKQFSECDHGWVVSAKPGFEEARQLIFNWLKRLFS
ncbi:alpha/beta hydrolase [uncultured Cohaesibacter sp.]|uniref:alpha/beta hydrolase n=1 Tax=uncultured Cohaesibacter sp. TaxID=1002546 RepID=UPI00292CCC55|nr:alpha/beta hydrolase [uncultured Cohaesibacter sp.]